MLTKYLRPAHAILTCAILTLALAGPTACAGSAESETNVTEDFVRKVGRLHTEGKRLILTETVQDGKRRYIISGKLTGMLREFYTGKVMQLDGVVREEAEDGEPGEFFVKRIAINID